MGDYCTVDQIKNYLTGLDIDVVTSDASEIQYFMDRSKDQIERATRMKFESTSTVDLYDGKGQQKLVLDHWPLITLSRVRIRNFNYQLIRDMNPPVEGTDIITQKDIGCITIPPTTYWLMPNYAASFYYWPYTCYPGMVIRGSEFDYWNKFGVGVANIEVTYTYGYATAPKAINDACLKMVVIELLKKKGTMVTQGVSAVSMAGISETFTQSVPGGGSGAFGHLIGELQKDIEADLKMYRSMRVGVI